MAQLDEYMRDAEENNLGRDAVNKAKAEAKKQAKKPLHKLRKKATSKFMEATGANELKRAAKKGIQAAGKQAAKTAGKFLLSNPVGWAVTAALVIGGAALFDKIEDASRDAMVEEVSSTLIVEERGAAGEVKEQLTEDGVAVLMGDCPDEKEVVVGEIDTDASMEANAKMLYSVFKGYGLTDECISGILGNLQAEGSIDPTTIEGIYDEPHQIGPKKQAAFADLSNYTSGTVFSLYAKAGISINKSAYQASDGNYYCGLGLVQWTGPGAYQMLSVGEGTGHEWYSMEYQLAYMVSDAHYRPGFFTEWKANPSSSAEDAAYYFASKYEGNTALAQAERKSNAVAWLSQMSSWEVDEAYYQSVVGLSQNMGGTASDTAMGEAAENCGDVGKYDNSSIASAAVSYAYPTKDEGRGNNGTALYQQVHENIFPGDPWFMSCDRSVACAIRWSGSDDEYPPGNTNAQYDYMQASPKWESVGMAGSLKVEDLMPGDIFILDGHVFMFVGQETVQRVHGEKAGAGSDSVSGSFEERSPGCGTDSSDIIGRGGEDWIGRGQYEVFRCVKPDNSPTYKNAGSSAALE